MPDHSPRRIVSLQPSATVILDCIGELDRVVACTKYCVEVCPGVKTGDRVVVADSWTAQSAEILTSHPDLVIAAVPYQEKAVTEILKAGIRFLGLAPKTLADIYTDVACIAGILGKSSEGERVIAEMEREIHSVRTISASYPRPRVFCEEWGKPLIASQPWIAELVDAAGGEFLGVPGAQIDFATVARFDPEILVAAWCGANDRVPLGKIIQSRRWQDMTAVRTG